MLDFLFFFACGTGFALMNTSRGSLLPLRTPVEWRMRSNLRRHQIRLPHIDSSVRLLRNRSEKAPRTANHQKQMFGNDYSITRWEAAFSGPTPDGGDPVGIATGGENQKLRDLSGLRFPKVQGHRQITLGLGNDRRSHRIGYLGSTARKQEQLTDPAGACD